MTKKNIVSIVLENCEYYDFDGRDVDIIMKGINAHYWYSKLNYGVEHCLIKIRRTAKTLNKLEDWQIPWQHRIHKDITQIQIDGKTYYVQWDDESELENEYQHDYEDVYDKIYIISRKYKKTEDFYAS